MNAIAAFLLEKIGFSTDVPSAPCSSKRIVKGVVPADDAKFRERFLTQADDPNEEVSHLQKRMQSGGP